MRGMLRPMFVRWFLAAQLIISCNVCMECLIQEDVSRISSIWTSLYIRRGAFRLGATGLVSSSELLPVPPAAGGHVLIRGFSDVLPRLVCES